VGSFEITAASIQGKGLKKGDEYTGPEFKVAVDSLKTGIDLRDTHLKEKLKSKEHPFIWGKDVKASKGRGTARFVVMGIEKTISFEFKELGNKLARATFSLDLSAYPIEGISYKGIGVDPTLKITVEASYDEI
jgi:hypothetical protein